MRDQGEESTHTHHVTSRLAPTEPGQLDNCIDFCVMLSVLKFLKRTLAKDYKWTAEDIEAFDERL